jgi:hypothetical protein
MYKHLLLVFLETVILIRLKILLMQSVNETGIHNSLHSYLVAIQMIYQHRSLSFLVILTVSASMAWFRFLLFIYRTMELTASLGLLFCFTLSFSLYIFPNDAYADPYLLLIISQISRLRPRSGSKRVELQAPPNILCWFMYFILLVIITDKCKQGT